MRAPRRFEGVPQGRLVPHHEGTPLVGVEGLGVAHHLHAQLRVVRIPPSVKRVVLVLECHVAHVVALHLARPVAPLAAGQTVGCARHFGAWRGGKREERLEMGLKIIAVVKLQIYYLVRVTR